MSEYIKKMAAVSVIRKYEFGKCPEYMQDWATKLKRAILQDIVDDVMEISAADVAPVKHGEWLPCEPGSDVRFFCNRCETEISTSWDYDADEMWKYCPNCGAKMDGESTSEH